MMKQMLVSNDPDLREQHCAVRNNVGWFDFTHHLVELTGSDAMAFLDKLYPAKISSLEVGKAKYTTMLDENAYIVDDVIIFRLEEQKYWLSTLYVRDMIRCFDDSCAEYDVEYRKITDEMKMYSVQGPNSLRLVDLICKEDVDSMKFFEIAENELVDGTAVRVARTGFTGEKMGFEVYVPTEAEDALVTLLEEKGAEIGATHVTEIDVMCMTLAAEVGYVLMMDIYRTTPFESDMTRGIDWNSDFVGKEALLKLKDIEPSRKLVGFTCDNDNALIYGGPHGMPVMKDGKIVGKATKYTHGFTCEKNIGYALIDVDKASIGDTCTISDYPVVLTERFFL